MQDHTPLNGSTALIVYTLGEIRADVRETRADIKQLTRRLDSMERPSMRDRFLDASGWLAGAIVLVLAAAGKWDLIGVFLGAGGK